MDEKTLYRDYLNRFRLRLIEEYDRLGLRASGSFERGLEGEVKGNVITMWGAHHSLFMEQGRRAGGMPPVERIAEWIENKKGLPQSFIENKDQIKWAIAKNIAKQGIKVPNKHNKGGVISKPLEQFLTTELYNMLDKVGIIWEKKITSDVIKILDAA